jgi:hypothetical protein
VEAADGKYYYDGDPHFNGINTARGKAVRTYIKCILKSPSSDVTAFLTTLEQVCSDASSAVRSCLIEFLPFVLRLDTRRVIAIFDRAVENRPELLACDVSHNFIRYAMGFGVPEMSKHVQWLTRSDLEKGREAAGRLATIAYLVTPSGRHLYHRCMQGDVALRQGVAEVLARNVDRPDLLKKCLTGLRKLMDDPDKNVREKVGDVFKFLPPPTNQTRRFVHSFLHSRSVVDAAHDCMKYAERIQIEYPGIALAIAERIQTKLGKEIVDIQKATALLDNDLVNLAISIQTHSGNIGLNSRAMDLFERVMDIGSHYARKALEEVSR